MTLQQLIEKYETPNRPLSQIDAQKVRLYVAAKQTLALEEIALQLRYIQETLRDSQR